MDRSSLKGCKFEGEMQWTEYPMPKPANSKLQTQRTGAMETARPNLRPSRVARFSDERVTGHEAEDIGNGGDLVRNFRLIGAKNCVAVLVGGMIPVHPVNRSLAHMARYDENLLAHQKNHFAEIPISKQRA